MTQPTRGHRAGRVVKRVLDPAPIVGKDLDPFGPARIVTWDNPTLDARAIYVEHNTARGPAIGGVRLAPEVTPREVYELARAMTWKNAAALIPHGGAKSSIVANPADFPPGSDRRRSLIEWFADCIAEYDEYIPGPDMGTDERDMQILFEKNGRAIGCPDGIPLDRLGLTALGVMHAFRLLAGGGYLGGLDRVRGTTIAVEGFGNVGAAFARLADHDGAVVVAASDLPDPVRDYGGVVYHPEGLDLRQLIALRDEGRSVVDTDQPGVETFRGKASLKSLFALEAQVLVPAARTNSVDLEIAKRIEAKLILQAANGPVTPEAEEHLHAMGVVCGTDYLVNCGGVIGGAESWAEANNPLGELRIPHCIARLTSAISASVPAVFDLARSLGIPPRAAAVEIVRPRIA